MENFRVTTGYGFKSFKKLRTIRQDKGHQGELNAFVQALEKGGSSPIPLEQLVNITRASFAAVVSAHEGRVVTLSQGL